MANYRPKSLDELNNLYGKSLNAQQEIVKKATVLEEKAQPKEAVFSPEENKPEIKTREQVASEQISGYVNDFIKSFGTPVKPDRTAAATVTASMKTVPVGKPAEPKKENEAVKAAAENQSEDKPRLIRNSERNSLFENYKKVMDDEDDYDFSEPEKEKKKSKKLFEKKASKPSEENKAEEAVGESKAETEEKKAEPAAEVKPEEAKPAKKSEAIVESEVEAKEEPEAEDKKEEKKKRSKAKKEKTPKEKKQKAPKESKGTVSRAIVMLLIFCVLLCATAVGGIKAFSGINTDSLVMDKYRVYTADRDYSRLGINSGDLVVVEHRGIDYNDVFAYKKNSSDFGFARLTTVLNDESVIADDGDLRCLVFNDTVRGVVYKTIPAVGSIAALIMSDFLVVLGGLLALAVILMLIAIFGCKPKKKKEKKEKPEKVKKEKKSRKNRKAEEADEVVQADNQDAEVDDESDLPDFEAIEADFSFLLQEYMNESEEAEAPEEAENSSENQVADELSEEPEAVEQETPAQEDTAPVVKYEISDFTDANEDELE